MMKKRALAMVFCSGLLPLTIANASDHETKHFKGVPAESFAQAIANLKEYNPKLASLMAKQQLTPADMAEIHQLTYSLENALARIKKQLEESAELLEDVHQASEKAQYDNALKQGRAYLERVAPFTR